MAFESVRGYIQLASGLGELSRARAMEAAQGLLSLPGVGSATGKVALQVGTLAEELLAAATTNREHLTTLVRSEVDAAVTRLGLVSAEKLEDSRAEAARLRRELAALRSASAAKPAATTPTVLATPTKAAPRKAAPRKAAPRKATLPKKASGSAPSTSGAANRPVAATVTRTAKAPATVTGTAKKPARATGGRRSSVTTRVKPAGT